LEFNDNDWKEKLGYYVDLGVVELEGLDENGEPIYSINEMAQELAPELWDAHMEHVDQALTALYEEGLLEVEYDEDLEPMFRISKEGYHRAKEYGLIDFQQEDIPND
jgi:DNA-binding transcriptional ArsR family regulator